MRTSMVGTSGSVVAGVVVVCLAATMCACGGGGGGGAALQLSIQTTSLPSGQVNVAYSVALSASGGTQPYAWAVTQGSLPGGLSLAASTISGTPTQSGSFQITITVTDAVAQTATRAFTLTIAPAGTTTGYHVATNGSDTNPGTAAQPWATVQHAADTVQAGDTVHVHTGTYSEHVQVNCSGTALAPITFRSAVGENVTIQSIEVRQSASHLRIAGFTVQGYSIWGVEVAGNNDDVVLSDLEVAGGECGVRFTVGNSGDPPMYGPVSNVTLENSTIRDTEFAAVDGTPGPCNNLTLKGLTVYGAGLVGQGSFSADGLSIEKGQNITVENCIVRDNGGDGIDLNSRDTSGNVPGIVVRNCQVYRNHLNGIKLWAGGKLERCAIWGQGINPLLIGVFNCTMEMTHNTIAYNLWSASYAARDYATTVGYPEPPEGPTAPQVNLTMRNNIFAFNTGPAVGTPTGIYLGPGVQLVSERDNVFYSRQDEEILALFLAAGQEEITRLQITDGTWATLSGQGQGDLTVDPQFVSGWPNVDLHLQAGSPASGRGAY